MDRAEAIALVRRAFAIWQTRLGEQHRYTQWAHNWLVENDPDFTMPSSRLQLSIREYWK